jgi:hypothetical protein
MTKLQSSLKLCIEMVKDLEEFERSGSKEAFRKQLREEFVRRSGAASLDEALVTAMTSLVPLLHQTCGPARKRIGRSPKRRKPAPNRLPLWECAKGGAPNPLRRNSEPGAANRWKRYFVRHRSST